MTKQIGSLLAQDKTAQRALQVSQGAAAYQPSKPLNSTQIQILAQELEPAEIRTIVAERDGKKLKWLTHSELHNAVVDIISEIKVLTGAIVFEDPKEMQAQVQVIKRFLAMSFDMLTKEEVIHAFYLNMQGAYDTVYRHYNRELNAEFMGDVLRAYLGYKLYLREIKGPTITGILGLSALQKTERPDIDYPFWKQMIQEEYELYCRNTPSLQLWHARKYYTLRKFGLLPFPKGLKTWLIFFKKVMQDNTTGTKLPAGANIAAYEFRTVGEAAGIFHSPEDYRRCLDYLRRYAYWYVLKACRECGIHNLWTEIENYDGRLKD